jgi:hypothetical protein
MVSESSVHGQLAVMFLGHGKAEKSWQKGLVEEICSPGNREIQEAVRYIL